MTTVFQSRIRRTEHGSVSPHAPPVTFTKVLAVSGGGRQEFLFVRRPGLCLGAFFGTRATSLVHAGLGFLWHPRAGMVVHSLNGDGGCWSTRLPDGRLDADGDLTAEYSRNVAPGQPFTVRYRTADSRSARRSPSPARACAGS
jgi:hypothetical protein